MKKTLLCILVILTFMLMGCSDPNTPEFSDEYLVGLDFGGASWGAFYDCIDARLIICADHDVLIFMPTAETLYSTKELEQIGKVTLSDEQFSNIEKALNRKELYYLKIKSNKSVLDGSEEYLILYDKDNNIAKKCGAYMPSTKEFVDLYDLILDNIPRDEIREIRKDHIDLLQSLNENNNKSQEADESETLEFTKYKTFSYDNHYYVEFSENDQMKVIEIHALYGGNELFRFEPCSISDFQGVCWEKDSFDLWVQSKDAGVTCYSMEDEKWTKNEEAVLPDYIILE